MSAIPGYFNDFLAEVRLTEPLERACREKHQTLREELAADAELGPIIIDAFLQGSYRRHTGVRPLDPDGRNEHVDVDLVVVTTLDHEDPANSPAKVLERFTPFLDEHYPDAWSPNDRSMKIEFDDTPVTLDLVVTAAPSMAVREELVKASEAATGLRSDIMTLSRRRAAGRGDIGEIRGLETFREAISAMRKAAGGDTWKDEQLFIPDRLRQEWVPTHPIAQIEWTEGKNAITDGHYLGVVRSAKWWRRRHDDPEYPKGYPLEHLIGSVCPNDNTSVAELLTRSLETIVTCYAVEAATGGKPVLCDHGVPENDVFRRVTPEDFAGFYAMVVDAAKLARRALDSPTVPESAALWRELLGPEFPPPPEGGGFAKRVATSTIASSGRYG